MVKRIRRGVRPRQQHAQRRGRPPQSVAPRGRLFVAADEPKDMLSENYGCIQIIASNICSCNSRSGDALVRSQESRTRNSFAFDRAAAGPARPFLGGASHPRITPQRQHVRARDCRCGIRHRRPADCRDARGHLVVLLWRLRLVHRASGSRRQEEASEGKEEESRPVQTTMHTLAIAADHQSCCRFATRIVFVFEIRLPLAAL
jgi:hypothetical protein